MRAVSGQVCQVFTVVSNWSPGSPQSQAASVIRSMSARARMRWSGLPFVRASSGHSASSTTACMKASETRTEWFAFWKKTES